MLYRYGGHIVRVIYEGSEHTPSILECHFWKKTVKTIIILRDMSDELYLELSNTSLVQ